MGSPSLIINIITLLALMSRLVAADGLFKLSKRQRVQTTTPIWIYQESSQAWPLTLGVEAEPSTTTSSSTAWTWTTTKYLMTSGSSTIVIITSAFTTVTSTSSSSSSSTSRTSTTSSTTTPNATPTACSNSQRHACEARGCGCDVSIDIVLRPICNRGTICGNATSDMFPTCRKDKDCERFERYGNKYVCATLGYFWTCNSDSICLDVSGCSSEGLGQGDQLGYGGRLARFGKLGRRMAVNGNLTRNSTESVP